MQTLSLLFGTMSLPVTQSLFLSFASCSWTPIINQQRIFFPGGSHASFQYTQDCLSSQLRLEGKTGWRCLQQELEAAGLEISALKLRRRQFHHCEGGNSWKWTDDEKMQQTIFFLSYTLRKTYYCDRLQELPQSSDNTTSLDSSLSMEAEASGNGEMSESKIAWKLITDQEGLYGSDKLFANGIEKTLIYIAAWNSTFPARNLN